MTGPPIDLLVVGEPKQSRRDRVAEIKRACDLIVDLTIVFGGSPATAYLVAAELAYALEDPDRRPRRWPT